MRTVELIWFALANLTHALPAAHPITVAPNRPVRAQAASQEATNLPVATTSGAPRVDLVD